VRVWPGAVALATVVLAGGGSLPGARATRVVLWGDYGGLLSGYGVRVEERVYSTRVKGRVYERRVVVVRDRRLVVFLSRLTPRVYAAAARSMPGVVRDVLFGMRRWRGWRRLLEWLPRPLLQRILGVKPFNRGVYLRVRGRRLVRAVKPDWRAWLFVRRLRGLARACRPRLTWWLGRLDC